MRELHLGDGPLEAVLLPEAGARLHRLRAFGHDLLRTPSDADDHLREPFFWGGYVMAPWCNRLAAGTTSLSALQRSAVERALIESNGHRSRAAEALGISVRTLQRKLKAWGLDKGDHQPADARFQSATFDH